MATKHSLLDYAHAREVVKTFPALITMMDNLIEHLEPYRQYSATQHIYAAAEEARILYAIQLSFYSKVYDRKGKINND